MYLNYPSNPCAAALPPGVFEAAVRFAEETDAAIVHDFAYGDLMFDRRSPESFLATPGAKQVGVEMFSMSKTYGMAGWRLGFVLGNAEIVERVNLLQDHDRAGIFVAVQEAGAFATVLEMVPADVAKKVTGELRIPTVGIGAGPDCDAQVLVWPDMAGLNTGKVPRFVKRYADLAGVLGGAAEQFAAEVREGAYPAEEHSFR